MRRFIIAAVTALPVLLHGPAFATNTVDLSKLSPSVVDNVANAVANLRLRAPAMQQDSIGSGQGLTRESFATAARWLLDGAQGFNLAPDRLLIYQPLADVFLYLDVVNGEARVSAAIGSSLERALQITNSTHWLETLVSVRPRQLLPAVLAAYNHDASTFGALFLPVFPKLSPIADADQILAGLVVALQMRERFANAPCRAPLTGQLPDLFDRHFAALPDAALTKGTFTGLGYAKLGERGLYVFGDRTAGSSKLLIFANERDCGILQVMPTFYAPGEG